MNDVKFRKMCQQGAKTNLESLIMLYILKNIVNIKKNWEGIRSTVNIKILVNPQIAKLNINGRIINVYRCAKTSCK